jgi:hypothetical protein
MQWEILFAADPDVLILVQRTRAGMPDLLFTTNLKWFYNVNSSHRTDTA